MTEQTRSLLNQHNCTMENTNQTYLNTSLYTVSYGVGTTGFGILLTVLTTLASVATTAVIVDIIAVAVEVVATRPSNFLRGGIMLTKEAQATVNAVIAPKAAIMPAIGDIGDGGIVADACVNPVAAAVAAPDKLDI